MRALCLLALFLAPALAGAAPWQATTIWSDDCETLYLDEADGDISQLCAGVGPYKVIAHESDLRQSLDIVDARGYAHRLDFWHHITPHFSAMEEQILWHESGADTYILGTSLLAEEPQKSGVSKQKLLEIAVKVSRKQICVIAMEDQALTPTDFGSLSESVGSAPCIYEPRTELAFFAPDDLQWGDRSCVLVGRGGKPNDADIRAESSIPADFVLCEERETLINQPLYLTYAPLAVAAPACEGDPDCTEVETVSAVTHATVRAAADCGLNEVVLLRCAEISACWVRDSGTVTTRINDSERRFDRESLSSGAVPFAGGGGAWLSAASGAVTHTLYSGVGKWGADGETSEKAGIAILEDGELEQLYPCGTPATSILGPAWFDENGIGDSPRDFDFSLHP